MNLPLPGETQFSNRGYRNVFQITIMVVSPHSLTVMSSQRLPRVSGVRPAPSPGVSLALAVAVVAAVVAVLAAPLAVAAVALAVVLGSRLAADHPVAERGRREGGAGVAGPQSEAAADV